MRLGNAVIELGNLDMSIYKCISKNIASAEVVVTYERVQHILKRHPEAYYLFECYIKDVLFDPDYILRSNRSNTGIVLKKIKDNGVKVQVVLKLATDTENKSKKNSIITFLRISERTWNKYLRNKEILYKKD